MVCSYQSYVLAIKTRGPPLVFVALIGHYLLQALNVKQMLIVYQSRIAVYMAAVCFGSFGVSRGVWATAGVVAGNEDACGRVVFVFSSCFSFFFLSFFLCDP